MSQCRAAAMDVALSANRKPKTTSAIATEVVEFKSAPEEVRRLDNSRIVAAVIAGRGEAGPSRSTTLFSIPMNNLSSCDSMVCDKTWPACWFFDFTPDR